MALTPAPVAGQLILASWGVTVTDYLSALTGVWTTFVPVVTQPGGIACTNVSSTYIKVGRFVVAIVNVTVTGAGTAANGVRITLPVTARAANAIFGIGSIYDASTGTRHNCSAEGSSTTQVYFGINGVSADVWGVSPNLALANGDQIKYAVVYESAA